MTWQIAISLHLILSSLFAIGQRYIAKRHFYSPVLTTALMYVLTVTPAGIAWAVLSGQIDFSFSRHIWFVLPISGLLFALANIFAFHANEKVDATQFNVIANLRNLVTVAVSSLFLSEFLTPKQLAGGLLLVSGAILISAYGFNEQTKKINKYTFVAVLSAVMMGSAISLEKYILGFVNFETYLIVGWGAQTSAMAAIALPQFKELKANLDFKKIFSIVILGLLRTFAGFMFIRAMILSDNSSLMAVLVSLKAPIVFGFAFVLLKEKAHLARKALGVTLTVLGLLFMV